MQENQLLNERKLLEETESKNKHEREDLRKTKKDNERNMIEIDDLKDTVSRVSSRRVIGFHILWTNFFSCF